LDTAGQEGRLKSRTKQSHNIIEFFTLRDQYIRQGEGYIIVYSITNRSSFEEVESFIDHILQTRGIEESEYANANKHVAIVVVANKADLENDRLVSKDEGREVCAKYGGIQFYEASAKSRLNVDEIFHNCATQVFAKVKKETGKDEKCTLM